MARAEDPGNPVKTEEDPELSVIVPCLNEELNLPELCERVVGTFRRGGIRGELVVVDDGSKDATAEVLRGLVEKHPGEVVGVFHPQNQGIARAWRSGAERARGRLVATIDADLQYQPEDLLRLRRALYEHAVDVVQGYRSPTGRRRDERYTLSRGFNTLLNGVFSMSLRDNKSGFVMCAREVFLDLLSYHGSYYYWQSFVMVAAHAKGYSYREVETLFEERRQGTSFLAGSNALKASARSFVDLAAAAWEYRLRPARADLAKVAAKQAPPPSSVSSDVRWSAYLAAFERTHFMITRDVARHHDALSASQWLEKAGLSELADEKLRRLLRHAYRDVPYYRARMQRAGLRPEDFRGRRDLAKLPILTRSDVREHLYFDILSENHDKDEILRLTTNGATGEPFVSFADRSQLELRWAAELRAREWTGYGFGAKTARLWDPLGEPGPPNAARDKLEARLANRTLLSGQGVDAEGLATMLRQLEERAPRLLEGDSELLELLARFAAARRGPRPNIPAILAWGQTLSDGVRRTLEATFGARVFDAYGTRELGLVAHECEAHTGHHVVAESRIVEILVGDRHAAPFEEGDVVVTCLDNFCLPFLRFRTGDRAIALPDEPGCPCGRASPRIGAILGRERTVLVGAGGRCVPGVALTRPLADLGYAFSRWQIVQTEPGAISFRFRKGSRYSDEVLAETRLLLEEGLGRGTRVDVSALVEPEGEASIVSRLNVDFDESGTLRTGMFPRSPARVDGP